MSIQPLQITLNLTPRFRFDLINVADKIRGLGGERLENYSCITCCSFHTTAGFADQHLFARLQYSDERLNQYIRIFQELFPPEAGYSHDKMELRKELSESQKKQEPPNADSHLTFMSAGLKNCVTYSNKALSPIYFIDLDGVYNNHHRNRRTTILAYNKEKLVYRGRFPIPVRAEHPINSLNLKDAEYGLFSHLHDLLDSYGIDQGRIDIRLASEERHSALTVNEYETLLMRNDLPEAMRNPLRYVLKRAKSVIRNPASIPVRARGYAVYDLIHLYNEVVRNTGIGRSVFDKALSYLSSPVSRIFQFKRDISFLVSNSLETGPSPIIQGPYQSPILLYYKKAKKECAI